MADGIAAEAPAIGLTLPAEKSADATHRMVFIGLAALLVAAPFLAYPVFVMKVLCFALFALAFNLLLGYGGLLSLRPAAHFWVGRYVSAHTAKGWGFPPQG